MPRSPRSMRPKLPARWSTAASRCSAGSGWRARCRWSAGIGRCASSASARAPPRCTAWWWRATCSAASAGRRDMSIDVDVTDGIATVTINRPERMNAMDAEHYKGLSQAWMRGPDDATIRVAIITGAGEKSFSAGADLKSFITAPAGLDEMWLTQRDQLLNRGLAGWKPVIAAVNGYCLAGGMTLLLGTDTRIAAEHATFNIAEVKRGILPGNGGTQRILDQLPYAIGMELLLTGDGIHAH